MARGLRRIRAEKQLTLRALSKASGVSKETISDIERGIRTPQTLTLGKLSTALGVDIDELLEDPTTPKAPAPSSDEPPEGVSDEERRFLHHTQAWIFLLDETSSRWEQATATGSVDVGLHKEVAASSRDVFLALSVLFDALEAEGLTPHRGFVIGEVFDKSITRWCEASNAVGDKVEEMLGETELAQWKAQKDRQQVTLERIRKTG